VYVQGADAAPLQCKHLRSKTKPGTLTAVSVRVVERCVNAFVHGFLDIGSIFRPLGSGVAR